MADQYYEPETVYMPGAIIRVYKPILTEEERAKRMKAIHDAAANLLRSEYERKKEYAN
jgi:ribosome recycling factor